MKTGIMMLAAILGLAAAAQARAQQPADGATVYAKMCASCHGARGTPNPATARAMAIPNLAAASVASVPDSVFASAILNGKGRAMPAYKTRLSAAQVAGVVAYIRTLSQH